MVNVSVALYYWHYLANFANRPKYIVDEPHSIMSFSLFYKWERNCGSSQKLQTAAKVGVIRNVSDT